MQGLYLKSPHSSLIATGKKSLIIKGHLFPELVGTFILCGDDKAFGQVTIQESLPFSLAEFQSYFPQHRVTEKEREKWWPDLSTFYSYTIKSFQPYPSPIPIEVPNGVQTIMPEVKFKTASPVSEGQKEAAMPYDMDNPPRPSKNWPAADKKKCIEAANAVLRKKGSEQDAIFACIRAAGRTKHPGGEDKKEFVDEIDFGIASEIVNTLYLSIPEQEDKAIEPLLVALPLSDDKTDSAPVSETEAEEVESKGEKETDESELALAEKAVMKTVNGEKFPASDFLVVEDPQSPSTWHLQVKRHGKPDHTLMGGAQAALISPGGHRGKKYEGPNKAEAIRKLKALYKAEKMEWGAGEKEIEAEDEKIGKRLRKDKITELDSIKGALEKFWKWVTNQDEEPDEDETSKSLSFKTFDSNGSTYLIIWPTNAFQDREGEIFETKAIADYIAAHKSDVAKGTLRYRHWPGTDFATILWQKMAGRFAVELAKFDDTPAGRDFKALFARYPNGHPVIAPEGWGTSHGFKYYSEDRRDKVFEWFDKWETSVLPARVASNPHNPAMEVIMDKKAVTDELSALDISSEVQANVIAAIEKGEQLTKEKEDQGVAHKESPDPTPAPAPEPEKKEPEKEPTPAPTTPTPTPAPISPADVETIVKALKLDDLAKSYTDQANTIATLTKELENLKARLAEAEKTADQKIAEKQAELPRFSWDSALRPSTADSTKLREGDPLKARTIKVPATIEHIAAAQLDGR